MPLLDGTNEGSSEKLSVEEAIKRGLIPIGLTPEEFEEQVASKLDERFNQLRCLIFVKDPRDPNQKISRLPNGKIVFLDKSVNQEQVVDGRAYICLVYEPTNGRQAFAKILGELYEPRIIVTETGLVIAIGRFFGGYERHIVKGQTLNEKIINAIKLIEKSGHESVRIIFRKPPQLK